MRRGERKITHLCFSEDYGLALGLGRERGAKGRRLLHQRETRS